LLLISDAKFLKQHYCPCENDRELTTPHYYFPAFFPRDKKNRSVLKSGDRVRNKDMILWPQSERKCVVLKDKAE
jgi:hypothetical protein